jgi:serine/threonine protein kinase
MAVDAPGRLIAGKYELLSPAGEGGMAVVWKALARGAGTFARSVAIKRIQNAKHADPQFIKMFEEEARVGSELHHPNIVQILDFGMDDEGGYYLVMEWIEGVDMFQWIRAFQREKRPTPWPLVAAIGIEVCRALAAAHERTDAKGVVVPVFHRDVSPSNVLLGTNGVVKLSDFGLARAMDRASMTRPNVIKGKLAYCAPELISGGKPSAQSDCFALCVVLWESLAQRRLFTGKNDLEVLLAVRKGDVPRLDTIRADLPQSLVLAIHQGLDTDPNARFENAKAMARAFASVLRSEAEYADSEPLGASVRSARQKTGIGPRHATGAEGEPATAPQPPTAPKPTASPSASPSGPIAPAGAPVATSVVEISLGDLEVSELRADEPVPKPAARGLWQAPDDRSTAVPLQKKK